MINVLFNTLQRQILAVLVLFFLVVLIFSLVLIPKVSMRYQQEIMQSMHGHLAQFVVDHYLLSQGGELDLNAAQHTFHDLMILGPNFEFYVLDKHGQILTYSADPEKVLRTRLSLAPIHNYLANGDQVQPMYGDDPRHQFREKVFSAAEIRHGQLLQGYLYVVLGSEIYDDTAQQVLGSYQLRWGMWTALAGLVACLLIAALLTRLTTGPISRLTASITANNTDLLSAPRPIFKPLNAHSRWPFARTREVIQLTTAFNQLIDKMSQQLADLKSLHDLRRELVSHISHDLRTPLASLMGYLETWQLRRHQLTDEQCAKYIAVAQNNAKKMHNLIEQLFELAHLESGDVKVELESFSIAELAQDVLQKFQLAAQKKRIQLRVLPKETHIHVLGDIEKLERVLSNLVDNALRHTEAGGSITVRLSDEGHLVAIEVADTGIGIPEDDLPRIFDAHYKAGNSVRGNTANGGLGLAITKKLLALHNSSIQVSSKCGKGTSFRFALPGPKSAAA